MDGVQSESLRLLCPELTDPFKRGEPAEALQALGEVGRGELKPFVRESRVDRVRNARDQPAQEVRRDSRSCPFSCNSAKANLLSFIKAWRTACAGVGYPGRIPHHLRRSAIRTFVRAGVSEHTAMALSGDKTASVFRRYDIVSEGDLDDAAERLDAAQSNAPARTSAQ